MNAYGLFPNVPSENHTHDSASTSIIMRASLCVCVLIESKNELPIDRCQIDSKRLITVQRVIERKRNALNLESRSILLLSSSSMPLLLLLSFFVSLMRQRVWVCACVYIIFRCYFSSFFTQFPCCTLWTNLIIKMYIIKIFSRAVCRWLWCFIFWLNWFSTHVMGHTLMMMGMICFSWQSIKIQIFHFLGERKHFR